MKKATYITWRRLQILHDMNKKAADILHKKAADITLEEQEGCIEEQEGCIEEQEGELKNAC